MFTITGEVAGAHSKGFLNFDIVVFSSDSVHEDNQLGGVRSDEILILPDEYFAVVCLPVVASPLPLRHNG